MLSPAWTTANERTCVPDKNTICSGMSNTALMVETTSPRRTSPKSSHRWMFVLYTHTYTHTHNDTLYDEHRDGDKQRDDCDDCNTYWSETDNGTDTVNIATIHNYRYLYVYTLVNFNSWDSVVRASPSRSRERSLSLSFYLQIVAYKNTISLIINFESLQHTSLWVPIFLCSSSCLSR